MEYKYFAFISYSRRNSRAAAFVQRKLEHFRIPLKHVAVENRPAKGRFVRPVFRDKRDLNVSKGSFTGDIQRALRESRYLLVICSREAASSKWVDEEVKYFLACHGNDLSCIVPIILEGDPGCGTDRECLPESLRDDGLAALGVEGRMTERNLPTMIPDEGAKEIDGWENGVIQTLSYLLKVNRESVKASIDAERVRQMKIYAIIAAACTCIFAALAFWAVRAERRADANRRVAEVHRLKAEENERRAIAGEKLADEKRVLAEKTLDFVKRMLQEGKPDEFGPKNVVDLLGEQVSKIDLLQPEELRYSVASLVGRIMQEQMMVRPAERLLKESCDYYRRKGEWRNFMLAANPLQVLYSTSGRETLAMELQCEMGEHAQAAALTAGERALHFYNTAISYFNMSKLDEAEDYLDKARRLMDDTTTSLSASVVALSASIAEQRGDFKRAYDLMTEAMSLHEKTAGNADPTLLEDFARIAYDASHPDEAEKYAQSARDLARKLYGENSPIVAMADNTLGMLAIDQLNYREALRYLEEGLSIKERTCPDGDRVTAKLYENLGVAYLQLDNAVRSKRNFERAYGILKRIYGEQSPELFSSLGSLGLLEIKSKNFATAEKHLKTAVKIVTGAYGKNYLGLINLYNNLALLAADRGEYESSLAYATEAVRLSAVNGQGETSNMAIALSHAAQAYWKLGMQSNAVEQMTKCVAIAKKCYPPKSPDRRTVLATYELMVHDGEIADGEKNMASDQDKKELKRKAKAAIDDKNRRQEAKALYEELLQVLRARGEEHSADYALALNQLGVLSAWRTNYAEAVSFYLQAIEIEERIYGKGHPELSINYQNVGSSLKSAGDVVGAIEYYTKSHEANQRAKTPKRKIDSENFTALAELYGQTGDYTNAVAMAGRAIACDGDLYGTNTTDVAVDYEVLADVCKDAGWHAQAVTNYLAALHIREGQTNASVRTMSLLNNKLGIAYYRQGDYRNARTWHRRCFELDLVMYGLTNRNTIVALANLGDAERQCGDATNAVTHLREAIRLRLVMGNMPRRSLASDWNNLALACIDCGRLDEALEAFGESLGLYLRESGREDRDVMVVYGNMADVHQKLGRLDEEVDCRRKALDIALLLYDETSSDVLEKYQSLADCLGRSGKWEKCIAVRKRIVDIVGRMKGPESPFAARERNLLGIAQHDAWECDAARESYREALRIYTRTGKDYRNSVATVWGNLGRLEKRMGNYAEAIQAFEQKVQILEEDADRGSLEKVDAEIAECRKLMNTRPIVRISIVESGKEGEKLGLKVGDVWHSLENWKACDSKTQRRDQFWKAAKSAWQSLDTTNRRVAVLRKTDDGWKRFVFVFTTSDPGFIYEISDMPKDEFDATFDVPLDTKVKR